MTTLPMQYFGHGSARIIMPRALTRHTRREWIISPFLIILLLSLTFYILHQLTLDKLLILKHPRTIIIMPQAPPLPEPIQREKLPPLRVVKEAEEVPKPIQKKTRPPLLEKPKEIIIREMMRPKPKSLAPLVPKPMKPLIVHKKQVPQKALPLKSKIPSPQLKAGAPLTSAERTKRVIHTKKRRELSLKTTPKAIAPLSATQKITATPVTRAIKRLQPVDVTTTPRLQERRAPTPAPLLSMASKRDFSPLLSPNAVPLIAAKKSGPRPGIVESAPPKGGPRPILTQWSAPGTVRAATTASAVEYDSAPPPRPLKPSLTHQSSMPGAPDPSSSALPFQIDDLIQIQGSTLGHSLRVQNLKEEIYKKTRFMAAAQSPYTYQIRHYRCRVIIDGAEPPMITLTFEPSDAPFDVVSALERILPRRRP